LNHWSAREVFFSTVGPSCKLTLFIKNSPKKINFKKCDKKLFNPLPPSDAVRKQKKKYFRGSFQFSIAEIQKKITPLET